MGKKYIAFTSMPFGEEPESDSNQWTRLYEYGIKSCEDLIKDTNIRHYKLSEGTILEIQRADLQLRSLGLKENVKEHIDNCDFAICVLTVNKDVKESERPLLNANILWEIGYAEAKDKPIVFLGNDESIRKIPALVGRDNLFCTFDPDIFKVGNGNEKYVEEIGKKVARDLLPFIETAISKIQERRPGRFGRYRVEAYSNRRNADINKFISSATSTIDILTTNLDYYLKNMGTPQNGNIKSMLEQCLENKVKVRLLVMDPDSHIAEYRAKQLGMAGDVISYREELRNSILEMYIKFEKFYGDCFTLKIYQDLPLQIMIRVDNEIITSFVTKGKRSRDRVHVKFFLQDEGVYDTFVSHFGSVYDSAKDIREYAWLSREINKRKSNIAT